MVVDAKESPLWIGCGAHVKGFSAEPVPVAEKPYIPGVWHGETRTTGTTAAFTRWCSPRTRTVEYFYDSGNEGAATFYGSLTLNTKARESFINGYLQLAVGAQQLADFHPSNHHWEGPFVDRTYTDARVQSSSTYVMLSPGLYFNLSESVRLLAGVRIAWDLEIEDVSPGALALPMVQCDFSL